jgi:hypothetical protein
MIAGINIILVLGIINFILILFQLISGLRLLKIRMQIHKATGITLIFTSLIHAALAIFV